MITKNYMSRLLLATACTAFVATTAIADNRSAPLAEDDVTLHKIKSFFDAAFITADFDRDGDLMIVDRGVKSYVRLDTDRKAIRFFSIWRMKKSVPEIEKLRLVNSLNSELILVRFCMPRPTVLWCDYRLLYEGGITPYAIVNSYRHFARVTRGAVVKDTENIIGFD